MNKIVLIVGTLVLLGAGIGGFLVLSNKNKANTTVNTETQTSDTQKSLKDLLALGTSQTCEFNDATSGSSGTVYVANSKMRGDFVTVSAQGNINAHMIVDGNTSYIWMDGQNTGMEMTFDVEAMTEAAGQYSQASVDVNQKLNYNCNGWATDNSKFTLPSGVQFNDLSSLTMPNCSACDSAPVDARAACRAALGCN